MCHNSAFTLTAILLLTTACAGTMPSGAPAVTESRSGWVLPHNDYEAMRRHTLESIALADQIMLHPVCRAQFESLPDWPTGPVLTEIVFPVPGYNIGTIRAWTDMGTGRAYVLVPTIRGSSVERLAETLIHERAHVASKSDYKQIEQLDGEKDVDQIREIKLKNELRVRLVTARCMRAVGIA